MESPRVGARGALGAWSACMKMSVACARCSSLPKEPLAHASVVRVGCTSSSGAKRAALQRSCRGAHAALDMRNGPENAPERRSKKASPVAVRLQRSSSSETRHCARSTASTARSTRSPQPSLSQSSEMVAGSSSGSRMSMATVKGGSTCCESHARHITEWSSISSCRQRPTWEKRSRERTRDALGDADERDKSEHKSAQMAKSCGEVKRVTSPTLSALHRPSFARKVIDAEAT